MKSEPLKQHHWLKKFVGEWTTESTMSMGPGKPPEVSKGTEVVRMVGDLWIICEGEGSIGGETWSYVTTLGFDPERNIFVGTWVGSMMTKLWLYEGFLNADETYLTLNSTGPSMSGDGKITEYQDNTEFKSDNHRLFVGRFLGEDGQWQEMFQTHLIRKTT